MKLRWMAISGGLAAAVVKIALTLLLAHGAYQLMREYGAAPAWSVAAASALPFGGLFTARRAGRGRRGLLGAAVGGALARPDHDESSDQ